MPAVEQSFALDDTDLALLAQLQQDSSPSNLELAARVIWREMQTTSKPSFTG